MAWLPFKKTAVIPPIHQLCYCYHSILFCQSFHSKNSSSFFIHFKISLGISGCTVSIWSPGSWTLSSWTSTICEFILRSRSLRWMRAKILSSFDSFDSFAAGFVLDERKEPSRAFDSFRTWPECCWWWCCCSRLPLFRISDLSCNETRNWFKYMLTLQSLLPLCVLLVIRW